MITSVAVYFSVYILSACLLKHAIEYKHSGQWFLLLIALLMPCIFAAGRYNVGTDFENYNYMYLANKTLSFNDYLHNENKDVFAAFVFSKIGSVFNSFNIFLLLFSVFTYLPIVIRLNEMENISPRLMSFLFLLGPFTTSFNITKQMAAASIIFFSFKYIYGKDLWKFLLCIGVGLCFHYTALICIPIYFLWGKYENSNKVTFKMFLIISIYILAAVNVSRILSFIGGRYGEYAAGNTLGMNLSFLLQVFWGVVYIVFAKKLCALNSKNKLLIVLYIIGIIFGATGFYSTYIKRVAIYFTFPGFMLMGQLPNTFNDKDNELIKFAVLIYSMSIFFLTFYVLKQSGIIPYHFRFRIGG